MFTGWHRRDIWCLLASDQAGERRDVHEIIVPSGWNGVAVLHYEFKRRME
jgi:hypothetical protein